MQAIIIAVDVSPEADPVIEALRTIRVATKTKVVLAHVLPPLVSEDSIPADVPRKAGDRREQALEAEQYLESLADDVADALEDAWDGEIAIEVASGDAAEEIVRLAGIYDADLIVLGSRGLEGMNRVILGSVSTQVVESAKCSVYVCKL
ncbi:MAG: universal stress protein [Cyanobacteria bacterium J06639_1]